ncbi:MAG: hypothetical protein JJ949_10650 [Roseicyclus sp.]|nr:hypothetical protein [Roseicyclus sp.]MBO6924168.1 hypothetical protein [Roseicyclus sp.]
MEPGSVPLKPRAESFARRVVQGATLKEAWQASARAVGARVPGDGGAQVGGSRAAATPKIAERIAFLKREKASQAAPVENISLEDVVAIMSEISDLLIESAMLAEQSGHDNLSVSLREAALAHHNRAGRVQRVQGDTPNKAEAYDASAALDRILCHC